MKSAWRTLAVMMTAMALLALTACDDEEEGATVTDNGLRIEITTDRKSYETGETVQFRLMARNTGSEPLTLDFRTGQRFDFQVTDESGETYWYFSEDQAFTQELGTVELGAGETVEYTAGWEGAETGDYIARGWLTTIEPTPRVETRFEVE